MGLRIERGLTARGWRKLFYPWGAGASGAEQVELQLFVTVLAGPQIERDGRELVDDGNGEAGLREIDAFQIRVAGVANVDAHVRNFRRGIISHLGLTLLPARGTINSTERPFVRAEHANQKFLRTIAFAAQHRDDGPAAAERAGGRSAVERGDFTMVGQIFGVRLEKDPGEQALGIGDFGGPGQIASVSGGAIIGRRQFGIPVPEIFNRALPTRRTLLRERGGGLRERRWRNLLDERQKSREAWQQQKKVQFIAQRTVRARLRRIGEGFLDFGVEQLLKRGNARVEAEALGGKRIDGTQLRGAADAAVPLAVRYGLGRDFPVTS